MAILAGRWALGREQKALFQVAVGRIGSIIEAPQESLPLYVYLDADGRSGTNRVWGGLVAVGETENSWLVEPLTDLQNTIVAPPAELKGRDLPDSSIVHVARRIRVDDHRVLFWANWFPEAGRSDIVQMTQRFLADLRGIRAGRLRLDAPDIQARYRRTNNYLAGLKRVNRHKLISILAHLNWLLAEIKRRQLGPQLASVIVTVDREDLPEVGEGADFLKLLLAASLQAAGMPVRLTGKALREGWNEGAVKIDLNGNSQHSPGLQLTDILLQVVQRKLPGYGTLRARIS